MLFTDRDWSGLLRLRRDADPILLAKGHINTD